MVNEYYESYYRNLEDNTNLRDLKERVKSKLHERLQRDKEFTAEDEEFLNPCNKISICNALKFIKNPVRCCHLIYSLIQQLNLLIPKLQEQSECQTPGSTEVLYHSETWDLMGRRWGKLEKDFLPKTAVFDISKIPDIYDCIKYDVEHNRTVLIHSEAWKVTVQLYTNVKHLADVVIPQEYGMTRAEKLTIAQGICTPLLKKIKADLQRNIEEQTEETEDDMEDSGNRLDGRYATGVSSPGRHVRTRLYFTSESHIHSLLTVLSHGGLVHSEDEQWKRALEYVSLVSELNYMTQIVIMLYEDPTKDTTSEERFHVELHFSPGVNCCVQKELPPGPGFRPHSRNHEQSQKTSFDNGTQGSSTDSGDGDEAAPHPHPSGTDLLCSINCSEKQVQQLFGKPDQRGNCEGTRKRCSGPSGGVSPLPGQLPSFQEEEANTEEGRVRMVERQLSTSDPIPIKKVAMESSSDKISVSDLGVECQGKPSLSRSFEESSRPRSLEMDMNIGTGVERDSPLSKDELALISRAQSMEDVVEEEGYRRGHRLSLQPGQKMSNYLKFLQELAIRQASGGSMASQLFSTAVISGSSSVPNLGAGGGACPESESPLHPSMPGPVSAWES